MSPRIVDRDEKRKCIALAAVQVFGETGYERTRIDDVARRAGIGKGTVYEYFRNKKELMDGALKELMAQIVAEIMPAATSELSPLNTLKELSRRTIRSMDKVGGAYRFFLEYMVYASRHGDNYGDFESLLEEYRRELAALIDAGKALGEFRSDLSSYETAAAIVAWFDGAVFHWIVLPNTLSLETLEQHFMDMILKGLTPGNSEDEGETK